jgi:hypothetical protein
MQTSPDCFLDVRITQTPLTLVDVPGYQTVWKAPEREHKGVYLWCVDYRDALLASYVGKTSDHRGFGARLWTELCDWRKGRYCPPVEIDAFMRGERLTIATPEPGHLTRELAALEPITRVLLAPLASDQECVQLESFIVNELRRHPFTFHFLGNLDKTRKYNLKPSPVVRIISAPPIIGLTAPIPN